MTVDAERMRRNLESTRGLVFSGQLLLELTARGMRREDAYRIVQDHAMEAWKHGGRLPRARVARDPRGARGADGGGDRRGVPPRALPRPRGRVFARVFGRREAWPLAASAAASRSSSAWPSWSARYLAARVLSFVLRAHRRRASPAHRHHGSTTGWSPRCERPVDLRAVPGRRLGGRPPAADARSLDAHGSTACCSSGGVLLLAVWRWRAPTASCSTGTRATRGSRTTAVWPREFGPLFSQARQALHRAWWR